MEEILFKAFIIILLLILLVVIFIVFGEIIAHKKYEDSKRFRQRLQYMRPYRDGYAFMDDPELNKAMQIMYITSDYIEFSDTGVDGKYHKIWEF